MACSTVSCGSNKFRMLEVKLQYASLNSKKKKKNKTYVNLWLDPWVKPDKKLKTRIADTSGGNKSVWEERFLFAVSGSILHSKRNTVLQFEICKARKYFKDFLVGEGRCDLNALFKKVEADDEEKKVVEDDADAGPVYDTEQEEAAESITGIDEEGRRDNLYNNKKKEDVDGADHGVVALEELNLKGDQEEEEPELKACTSIGISKGTKEKGTLNLDVTLCKGHLKSVGDPKRHQWQGWAMAYDDDFMGEVNHVKVKSSKHQRWHCFAGYNTDKED